MGEDILAASAVVVDAAGRFLLVKRGHEPAKGLWSLPGGSVEEGETLREAAIREVFEETRLHITVYEEVWHVRVPLSENRHYDIHSFHAQVTSGLLQASDDADEAAWFTLEEATALPLTPLLGEFLTQYRLPRMG
jgi:8-oxo-dGTP diphosphatase